MSYSIDNVEEINLDATMYAKDVMLIVRDFEDDLPEECFLRDMRESALDALIDGKPEEPIDIDRFDWCGNFSGDCYENLLLEKIAPLIHGRVEVIFNWDCGDIDGLSIKDGVVTKCDVVRQLVPKKV